MNDKEINTSSCILLKLNTFLGSTVLFTPYYTIHVGILQIKAIQQKLKEHSTTLSNFTIGSLPVHFNQTGGYKIIR